MSTSVASLDGTWSNVAVQAKHAYQSVIYCRNKTFKTIHVITDNLIKDMKGLQTIMRLATSILSLTHSKEGIEIKNVFTRCNSFFDAVFIFQDIAYIRDGEIVQDIFHFRIFNIATQFTYLATDIACSLAFLKELDCLDLNQLAQNVGSVQLFGSTPFQFVTTLSIGTSIVYLVIACSGISAVTALKEIHNGQNIDKNLLKLLASVAKIASLTFFISTGAMAGTALYWGIASGSFSVMARICPEIYSQQVPAA